MSNLLWKPSVSFVQSSNLQLFINYVNLKHNLNIEYYPQLHKWSVSNISIFWETVLQYYLVEYQGTYSTVFNDNNWPLDNLWFKGIKVNYAQHILKKRNNDIAIIWQNELGEKQSFTYTQLYNEVAQLVSYLKSIKIVKGDRVVAYTPNLPQTIVSFLAVQSIGAIWSSCSPDFGTSSVVDRFAQIEPKLLIAASNYSYNGVKKDKKQDVEEIISKIPSIQYVISIDDIYYNIEVEQNNWTEIKKLPFQEIEFEFQDFNSPIWILYSSGTTGKPKAITHSVGGILLEHLKAIDIHQNVRENDIFLWYSTTGWMMWNYANAALLKGACVAIYEGSPSYPSLNSLWDFVDQNKITHFGAGAAYFAVCMQNKIDLNSYQNFPYLQSIGATGSPLTDETFDWLYQNVKNDLWLISLSGGTDICSGMVGGVPSLPVYKGEIQYKMLGVDMHAYNDAGESVVNELGELVIQQAMPSMPIYFWNDEGNEKYFKAYFEDIKGVWRHGDWVKVNDRGGIVIFGRSDSTLNRGGVRIGTAEVYNALLKVEEVQDGMVVCVDYADGKQWMPLFVKLSNDEVLTNELIIKIKKNIRQEYSPRHVPDDVILVKDIPYTLSGKKMETPIKKLLMGKSTLQDISKDSMKNPECLNDYLKFIKK
jgi:acetoacetyl-CoA synthetase